MKKLLFIILLCFLAVFVVIAMPMSPHPGDSLEMILTVSDDVVMIQDEIIPAVNILHLESIYNYDANEICVSAEANDNGPLWSAVDAVAVSYIGYEMDNIESDNKMLIVANIDESRGGTALFAEQYKQVIFFS